MPGTTYNKSGNISLLQDLTSYAQEDIRTRRVSQLFNRNVIFALMMSRFGQSGELGRPGAYAMFGGKPSGVNEAQQSKIAAYERKIRVHSQKSSGFKSMGIDDTSPAVDRAQSVNNTSAQYRYWHTMQAIKVRNDDKRFAQGKYSLADATTEATEEAINVLADNLSPFFYLGAPSDQTSDKWDQPAGLAGLMNTTNTFAGLNRSNAPYSTCWIGKRVTGNRSATLSLIDEANITQGATTTGPGIDTVLCGSANYLRFKAEAQARGQYQALPSMPGHSEVGAKWQGFVYEQTWILFDPFIQDYSTGTWPAGLAATNISNYVFMLASKDLHMDIHPDGNFAVSPFIDQHHQFPGGEDAITANIEVLCRPWYEHPNWHVLFTAVS